MNEEELQILFVLYLIVIIFKACLSVYLGARVVGRAKRKEEFELDFLFGVFFLMVCLLISRSLYLYFDFFLTGFDTALFHVYPNIVVWKFAALINSLGFVVLLFIFDMKALKFKTKGALSYAFLAIELFRFFYPVNSEADFRFISAIGFIEMPFVAIIPITFIYMGIKVETIRKKALIVVLGILIYGLGGILVGESTLGPLREAYGTQIHIFIFLMFLISKIVGLSMLSYSFPKFYAED